MDAQGEAVPVQEVRRAVHGLAVPAVLQGQGPGAVAVAVCGRRGGTGPAAVGGGGAELAGGALG